MIRVVAANPESAQPEIQIEDYIPLKVRLTPGSAKPPVYWRTGDFKRSLVEVGLDPRSGRLVSVTVTLVQAEHTREILTAPDPQPSDSGAPILDISDAHGPFIDDPGSVLFHLGPGFVWLSFTQDTRHVRELHLGGLRFLIGENEAWIGLIVEGLTDEQMAELRTGIPRA